MISIKIMRRLICYFFFGIISFFLYQNAEYDWDLPGYIGSILKLENNNDAKIHQNTYKILNENTTPVEFSTIIGHGKGFRFAQYKNAVFFNSQIQYYEVKRLYVFLGYALYKLGISLIKAILFINFLSAFLAACLIFNLLLAIGIKNLLVSFLITLNIILFPWMAEMKPADF